MENKLYSNLWPKGEWFTKHLNWTVVLHWLLVFPLSWGIVIGYTLTESEIVFIAWSIVGTIWIIGLWYLLIWNLKHKGRSLFNLFYLLIPFGIGLIVFLCISNRGQLAKEKAEREERDKYIEEYWKEHGKAGSENEL